MSKEFEKLCENVEFLEFLLCEAEATLVHATAEDLAVFGFGSIEDAVEAYKEHTEGDEDDEF
jgi:hypothetical protein